MTPPGETHYIHCVPLPLSTGSEILREPENTIVSEAEPHNGHSCELYQVNWSTASERIDDNTVSHFSRGVIQAEIVIQIVREGAGSTSRIGPHSRG